MKEVTLPEWKKIAEDCQVLNIWDSMLTFSSRSVFLAFMGDGLEDVPMNVLLALNRAFSYVRNNIISVNTLIPQLKMLEKNGNSNQFGEDMTIIRNFVKQFIDVKKDSDTMMGSIIRAHTKDGFVDQEMILQETVSNLIGGSETTILMMSWGLYYLSKEPRVQECLYEIVRESAEDVPTLEEIKSWPYLRQTLNEILRLASPSYLTNRPAVEDTVLSGYKIPAGTLVWASQYITHRNPHIWQSPDQFMPERFDKNLNTVPGSGSFFPFSLGARMCIGNSYAYLEAGICLATIVKHFTFSLVDNSDPGYDANLTFRPKKQILVRLTPRLETY